MKRKCLRLAAVAPLALLLVALGLQCPPAQAGNTSWFFKSDVMSACGNHPAIKDKPTGFLYGMRTVTLSNMTPDGRVITPDGREHHAMLHECEARILSDPRVVSAHEHATAAWALFMAVDAVMATRQTAWMNLADSRSSDVSAVREADRTFEWVADYTNDWLSAAMAYEAHLPSAIRVEKRRIDEERARRAKNPNPVVDGLESIWAEHEANMAPIHAKVAAAVPGYKKMRAENADLANAIAAQRGNASTTLTAAIAVSVGSLTERQLRDGAKKRFPAVDRCLERGRPPDEALACLTDLEQQVFRNADAGARHAPD